MLNSRLNGVASQLVAWKDTSQFPLGTGEWQVLHSGKMHSVDENTVRKLAGKWFLTQQKLVSTPQTRRFLPAICVPEISDLTHRSFLRRFRVIFYILGFYLFLTSALAVLSDTPAPYLRVLIFLTIGIAYFYAEYSLILRPYESISDRALFYFWMLRQRNIYLETGFWLFLGAGLFQLFYQARVGDLDSLVIEYGTYFKAIESGELWRYASGPFIHASLMHWMVNAFFLVYLIKMIGKLADARLLVIFLASLPLSAASVHFFSDSFDLDGFVGISGGVYCLFGWLVATGIRHKNFFPANFAFSIGALAAVNLLLPALFNYNSSLLAHASGFAVGLLAGLFGIASKIDAHHSLGVDQE